MILSERTRFKNPAKLCSGEKALTHIPFELGTQNARKPLIVTDREIHNDGRIKNIEDAFRSSGLTFGLYNVKEDDPGIDTLKKLTGIYTDNGYDAIITAGNSALVRMAKILNIVVSGKPEHLTAYIGKEKIKRPLNPFYCIATGPDLCQSVAREVLFQNHLYISDYLVPDLVIIDPEILSDDDQNNLVDTSLEAFASSMEAYLMDSNPFVRSYAGTAVNIIVDHLADILKVVSKKEHFLKLPFKACPIKKKRAKIYNALYMAGVVISNRESSFVRKLGIETANHCDCKPGIIMGILLPNVLEFFSESNHSFHGKSLLPLVGTDLFCRTPEYQRHDHIFFLIRNFINELSLSVPMPVTLEQTGLNEGRLEQVALAVSSDKKLNISSESSMRILEHAYHGSPLKADLNIKGAYGE